MSTRARVRPCLAAVGAAIVALTIAPDQAAAAVPDTIAVQGALLATGGGAVSDGGYDVTFALYAAATGGDAVWSEGPVQVAVFGGRFAYTLGTSSKLDLGKLAAAAQLWIGVRIGNDPELGRKRLHSVAFALQAEMAQKLGCSGCLSGAQLASSAVQASHVAFTFAGSSTKGGAANKALDVACTGCVSVAEIAFDADVDLKDKAISAGKVITKEVVAQQVTAGKFIGDGSELTGIKTPSGECATAGDVVRGIDATGKLICAPALDTKALAPDLIDEVSNGLIWNQFDDGTEGTKNKPIKDNNPFGTTDELDFPDVGVAQRLDVDVYLENSSVQQVVVKLFDPKNAEYVLHDKSGTGKTLTSSWPYTQPSKTGDLKTWTGKNPKGKWRLQVIDTADNGGGDDGKIVSWGVRIRTLSGKKIRVAGALHVDGDLHVKGAANFTGNVVFEGGLQTKGGGLALPTASEAPAKCDAAHTAHIYFDTKRKRFYGCDGTGWVKLQSTITGVDIMATKLKMTVDSNTGGSPNYTADKISHTTTNSWTSYCVQSSGANGTHWIKVDFGGLRYIEQFGVSGYAGGSHKPTGTWRLEGSLDDSKWVAVWSGDPSLWTTGGVSYPPQKTINVTNPGDYRFYRIIATGWTNGHLLVCNWAMYE